MSQKTFESVIRDHVNRYLKTDKLTIINGDLTPVGIGRMCRNMLNKVNFKFQIKTKDYSLKKTGKVKNQNRELSSEMKTHWLVDKVSKLNKVGKLELKGDSIQSKHFVPLSVKKSSADINQSYKRQIAATYFMGHLSSYKLQGCSLGSIDIFNELIRTGWGYDSIRPWVMALSNKVDELNTSCLEQFRRKMWLPKFRKIIQEARLMVS